MTRVAMTRPQHRYAMIAVAIVLPYVVSSWSGGLRSKIHHRHILRNLETTLQEAQNTAQTWIVTASIGAALASITMCPGAVFADDATELAMPPLPIQSTAVPTKTVLDATNAEAQLSEQHLEAIQPIDSSAETYQTDKQRQSDAEAKGQVAAEPELDDWKPILRPIDTPKVTKAKNGEESKSVIDFAKTDQVPKRNEPESNDAPIRSTDATQPHDGTEAKPRAVDSLETAKGKEKEEFPRGQVETTGKVSDEESDAEKSFERSSEVTNEQGDESLVHKHLVLQQGVEKEDKQKDSQTQTRVETESTAKEGKRPMVESIVKLSETAKLERNEETSKIPTKEARIEQESEALKSAIGNRQDKSSPQVRSTESTKDIEPSKTLVCSLEAYEIHCYLY